MRANWSMLVCYPVRSAVISISQLSDSHLRTEVHCVFDPLPISKVLKLTALSKIHRTICTFVVSLYLFSIEQYKVRCQVNSLRYLSYLENPKQRRNYNQNISKQAPIMYKKIPA